jgi:hypothetical protein
MLFLGFKHVCSGQKFHHSLHLLVPADAGLRVGNTSVGRSPSHPVAHEIDRPLEDVLAAVEKFLRLLSKRKGM